MSNRDDFDNVAVEILESYRVAQDGLRHRIETELHNAFVAGQESVEAQDSAELRKEVTRLQWLLAGPSKSLSANIVEMILRPLTVEERLDVFTDVFENYCKHCASAQPKRPEMRCQCQNDE